MQNRSVIQFPLLGIAAQSTPYDGSDFPDLSPRGSFIAVSNMRLLGGYLRGKADFIADYALYLDGDDKYIQSLAKLINKGHCEWGRGDLLTSDNGDFQNIGTVQLMYDSKSFDGSVFYRGTATPEANGGDVFALDYHNYDTAIGDSSEYLILTSEFVSRVPRGFKVQ